MSERRELILHHDYRRGTDDLSGNGHRGTGDLTRVDGRDGTVLQFDGEHSRVFVPPSPTLARPGGVVIRVTARPAQLGRRRTLVEGYLSFALFVESTGALGAGVLRYGRWSGLASPPGEVVPGAWITVALVCLPSGLVALHLDDLVVAELQLPAGDLDGVHWPFGLSIGAWPDADERVWCGEIEEVRLWHVREGQNSAHARP